MILILFISTNIDELCVLIILFSLIDTRAEGRKIVIGEYLGVGAIIAISLAGSLGISIFLDKYEGLLGLIPISIGIKAYIDLWKRKKYCLNPDITTGDLKKISGKPTVLKVFLIILADSGDSIGIYLSVFSNMNLVHIIITIILFMIIIAFWCYLGFQFSKLQIISRNIKRFRQFFVPTFFVLLGLLIMFNFI